MALTPEKIVHRLDLLDVALVLVAMVFAYLYFSSAAQLANQQTIYSGAAYTLSQTQASLNHTKANLSSAMSSIAQADANLAIMSNNYNAAHSNYTGIVSGLQNPYVRQVTANASIIVPRAPTAVPFYNANYRAYNNYTADGTYNTTFNAQNDGYLIVYIRVENPGVQTGTYGFITSSSSSAHYNKGLPVSGGNNQFLTQIYLLKAVGGYTVVPNATATRFIVPVMRGMVNFSIFNANPFQLNATYSLTYVGLHYTNYTKVGFNYTASP